ncbi:MAG: lipase family protein [Acidobacteria bacterium]|nr:lipase family protein [Acidobacteriota bacterium]
MNFDNGWCALTSPGRARVYFDRPGAPPFDAGATAYSPINAWWLAEISRLMYRAGGRGHHLRQAGLREVGFFSRGGTQGGVVATMDGAATPFTVLAFRGTDGVRDWITDLDCLRFRWSTGGNVHRGFAKAVLRVWEEIETLLGPLDAPLFITGHSLGAALATLAATLRPPRAVYNFGSPLTGDERFTELLSAVRLYRVVNNLDIVTTIPPWIGLRHGGELHYIGASSRVMTNPDRRAIAADREARVRASGEETRRRLWSPPQLACDHAPVNYVAHLERAALASHEKTAWTP